MVKKPYPKGLSQSGVRTFNKLRENFPTQDQYTSDKREASFKKDIRANPGSRSKKSPAPVGKGGR